MRLGFLSIVFLLFTSIGYTQTVRYVGTANLGLADGSSWSNATINFQAMIDASVPGDSVFVKWGYITVPSAASRFHMKSGVAIFGGFAGTEANTTQRTFLRASEFRNSRTGFIDDSISIFINTNVDNTAILDGFTFLFETGGDTTASCIQNYSSNPIIRNCKFNYNKSISSPTIPNGGGIRNFQSNPTFINCIFYDNKGTRSVSPGVTRPFLGGEVMYNLYSTPKIINCSFFKNEDYLRDGFGNSTGIAAPGYSIYNDIGSSIVAVNSIFYDKVPAIVDLGGIRSSVTYSLAKDTIGGGTTNFENVSTSPYNEGVGSEFSLIWNSVAREGGDPLTNTIGYPIQTGKYDVNFNNRIVGTRVDMGAYELNGATYPFMSNFSDFTKTYGNAAFSLSASSISPATITYSSADTTIAKISGSTVTIIKSGTVTLTASQIASGAYPANSSTAVMTVGKATLDIIAINSSKVVGQTNPQLFYKLGTNGLKNNDNSSIITGTLGRTAGETVGTYTINVGSLAAGNNYNINFTAGNFYIGVSKYVKPVGSGLGNATSWADASGDLQATITLAGNGDQIWVAAGTYTSSVGTNAFSMKDKVAVYGGFIGTETLLSQRDWASNQTTLTASAAVTSNALIDNGTFTLTSLSRLDGFTVTNSFGGTKAGGLYNNASSPTISNCIFTNNSAGSGGTIANVAAVMNNNGSNPIFVNTKFLNNTSGNVVGAIYDTLNSSPQIINCTFSNNSTGIASGIYNTANSNPIITNSILWGGVAPQIVNSVITSASIPVVTYSNIQQASGTYTGTGNLNIDPLYNLADFTLLSSSTLIDAGDPNTNVTILSTQANSFDLKGATRINSDYIDMGAYEFAPTIPAVITGFINITKTYGAANFTVVASSNSPATITYTSSDPTVAIVSPAGVVQVVSAGTITITAKQRASGNYMTVSSTLTLTINKAILDIRADTLSKLVGVADPAFPFTIGANALLNGDTSSIITGTLSRATGETSGAYAINIGTLSAGNNYTINFTTANFYIGSIKYVKQIASGSNDATSWANAASNLQLVLNNAIEGDQIWVAAGTYLQSGGSPFVINYNVKVYGGFIGTETVISQRDWNVNPTIMEGNSNTVIKISNVSNKTILDGFILTKGLGNNSIAGGVHLYNASPIIANCIIKNNTVLFEDHAYQSAGMTNTFNSNPTIYNCIFSKNTILPNPSNGGITTYATGFAGAVAIMNNNADPVTGVLGTSSTSTIYNTTFFGKNTVGSNTIPHTIYSAHTATTRVENSILFNQTIGKDNTSFLNVSYSDILGSYTSSRGHNVNVNPNFVDTVNDDYRLISNSPLIDAGDPNTNINPNSPSVGTFDYAHNSRIFLTAIDMGAYELQGIISVLSGFTDSTKTYGNRSFQLTAVSTSPTPITFFSADTTIAKLSGVNSSVLTILKSGTVTISALQVPNGNYFPDTLESKLTILKANITISADSITKRKRQIDPALTYTIGADGNGLLNNDLVTSVITGSLTRTVGENEGVYPISIGTLTANNNYNLNFTGSVFTIKRSGIIKYVKQDATGDGSSWDNASGDIQAMIDLLNESDSVWVAKGSYNKSTSYAMKNGVQVYGGFAGTETKASQRVIKNNLTILLGSYNDQSIVNFQNCNLLTQLDGFTIKGSYGSGFGGGVAIEKSNVEIINCIFSNNFASYGAGIASKGTATDTTYLNVINCTFFNNSSTKGGGSGIFNMTNSKMNVYNSVFNNNNSIDSTGGAILDLTRLGNSIINTTFYNNHNASGGSTLYLSYDAKVVNTIIMDSLPNPNRYNNIKYSIIPSSVIGVGNINNDTLRASHLFVDSLKDLSLKPSAIAVDAGDSLTNTTNYSIQANIFDAAYNNRIVWGRIDIGAYELQTLRIPRIDFPTITKNYGEADFQILSTTNSLAAITYTSSDTTIAIVYKSTTNNNWYVKIKDYGKIKLKASLASLSPFLSDSIETIFTIAPLIVTSTKNLTQCGTLVWNDSLYSASGIYNQTFKHIRVGVDSIASINFTYKANPTKPVITNKINNVFSSIPSFNTSIGNDNASFGNDPLSLMHIYTHQLCSNATDSIYLSSSSLINNQWYFNGAKLIGDTSNSLTIRKSGVYRVSILSPNGCSSISDVDSIFNSDIEGSTLNFHDSLICKATTVPVQALAIWNGFRLNDFTKESNLVFFKWTSKSGNFIDSVPNVRLSLPDTYYVKMFARGCLIKDSVLIRNTTDTAARARLVMTQQAFVNQPIKVLNITSQPADSFQWLLPTIPQSPTVLETSDTSIILKFSRVGSNIVGLRCISQKVCISEDYAKVVTTLNDSLNIASSRTVTIRDISIGPNPSITGIFNAKITLNVPGVVSLRVVSLQGGTVITQLIPNGDKVVQQKIDLSSYTSGTYVLVLQTANGYEIRTLLNKY